MLSTILRQIKNANKEGTFSFVLKINLLIITILIYQILNKSVIIK